MRSCVVLEYAALLAPAVPLFGHGQLEKADEEEEEEEKEQEGSEKGEQVLLELELPPLPLWLISMELLPAASDIRNEMSILCGNQN